MTTTTADQLRAGLDALLDGLPPRQTSAAVERLIAGYRGGGPGGAPVLRDRADAVAYAAYRMPATHAAVTAALTGLAERRPGWSPAEHLDIGGGTGAAAWAAAGVWPPRRTVLLDRARPALQLGRELAEHATAPALRAAEWRHETLGAGRELPPADLVTACYVLGELPEAARDAVVAAAVRATRPGGALVLVEPGTPEGYRRVRAARDRLTAAGLRVLAPCPHALACPVEAGTDWCHFAARVGRSSFHRRVKGGTLGHEDEKFSYVAVVRAPDDDAPGDGDGPPTPPAARVVRHPQIRKGQVLLDLCTPTGELRRETVTKRRGAGYRAARDTAWGDSWPPAAP
ncbi:small ribosomal subunit Rsm22 family protein [Streptomyces sp. 4N509B]|uniref:small ribosomal subunit Rsm22 family protein n=1 Tax=Streptomyces sp. 4N509B TaxID=3457413 RepID=UPI003FCF3C8B